MKYVHIFYHQNTFLSHYSTIKIKNQIFIQEGSFGAISAEPYASKLTPAFVRNANPIQNATAF